MQLECGFSACAKLKQVLLNKKFLIYNIYSLYCFFLFRSSAVVNGWPKLLAWFPETCCLVVVGFAVGGIFYATKTPPCCLLFRRPASASVCCRGRRLFHAQSAFFRPFWNDYSLLPWREQYSTPFAWVLNIFTRLSQIKHHSLCYFI